jgi:hypothetical protein
MINQLFLFPVMHLFIESFSLADKDMSSGDGALEYKALPTILLHSYPLELML